MKPEELKNKLNKIRVQEPLVINRIAPNTRKRFHEIASYDDFCSDYGNVLKYLIDVHDGLMPTGNELYENLQNQVNVLKAEINSLKIEQKKPPVRKMLGGNIIEQNKGDEKNE